MNYFSKTITFIIALFFAIAVQAQSPVFSTPTIWLRADSAGHGNVWHDMSGNGYHAHGSHGAFDPDSGWFNYQPCLMFDSLSEPLWVDYTAKQKSPLIVFAVYRPTALGNENGIWSLRLDSTEQVKLTSQKLGVFGNDRRYADSTYNGPVLNLLKLNWRAKDIDTNVCRLYVVGTDSLNFAGKFAEFMMYDSTLKKKEILRIHTYLAIKYGINIREMNYVNSMDSAIWNYETDSLFSNNIAGIGKDSLLLVDQKQSCGRGGEANLIVAAGQVYNTNEENNAVIGEMDYLLWGDNGKALNTFSPGDSLSQCAWLMKRSGATAGNISTMLVLHAPEITDAYTLSLIVSREADFAFPAYMVETVLPDSTDTLGNYYFSGMNWDIDNSGSDAFTFQLCDTTSVHQRSLIAQEQSESGDSNQNAAGISSVDVYPNPGNGEYFIEVKLTQPGKVLVSIQDESGKFISSTQCDGASFYSIPGTLTTKGCYLIKTETAVDSKTTKLIVQ